MVAKDLIILSSDVILLLRAKGRQILADQAAAAFCLYNSAESTLNKLLLFNSAFKMSSV